MGHKGRPEKAPQKWTKREIALLKKYWPSRSADNISWMLSRTAEAVESQAYRLGLYKSARYLKRLRSGERA